MPFKSKAQRAKFYVLKAQGKMSQDTIDEWEKNTPKNLPERIGKKHKKSKHSTGHWSHYTKLTGKSKPRKKNMKKTAMYYFKEGFEKSADERWVEAGAQVEKEHTNDINEAREIAKDHLREDPDYYKDWKNKERILFQKRAFRMRDEVTSDLSTMARGGDVPLKGSIGGAFTGAIGGLVGGALNKTNHPALWTLGGGALGAFAGHKLRQRAAAAHAKATPDITKQASGEGAILTSLGKRVLGPLGRKIPLSELRFALRANRAWKSIDAPDVKLVLEAHKAYKGENK